MFSWCIGQFGGFQQILRCLTWHKRCFGTVRFRKIKVLILNISFCPVILCNFFQIHLIFWTDIQMILRMILVICDYVSVFHFRGLLPVFGVCDHVFPYVATYVITYVTIAIWKFCAIFNAVPLVICYLMCCCMPYLKFLLK